MKRRARAPDAAANAEALATSPVFRTMEKAGQDRAADGHKDALITKLDAAWRVEKPVAKKFLEAVLKQIKAR